MAGEHGSQGATQAVVPQAATTEGAALLGGKANEGNPQGHTSPEVTVTSPEEQGRGHALPYTIDLTTGEPLKGIEAKLIRIKTIKDPNAPGGLRKIEINYNEKADGFVEKTKALIPQNDGESEFDYNVKILDEVGKRVRFRGDYRDKEDAIYDLTKTEPEAATLLMAIEAKKALLMQAENEKALKQAIIEGALDQRRQVRTAVRHDAIAAELAGNFDKFFAEKPLGADGKPAGKMEAKELPEGDLTAFTFIADRLMDVQDAGLGNSENGQPLTYREAFAKLL
ncbi:MAG: hypothetical protein Q7K43_05810, partial [Candidatus Woesearchaeota archaeon]|nr:hypothetical protein [Candidatus Woesearchaeota archaeon]